MEIVDWASCQSKYSVIWRHRFKKYLRPHDYAKTAFQKKSTLETVFKKIIFSGNKIAATCGRKAKPDKNDCIFKNIPICVDQ